LGGREAETAPAFCLSALLCACRVLYLGLSLNAVSGASRLSFLSRTESLPRRLVAGMWGGGVGVFLCVGVGGVAYGDLCRLGVVSVCRRGKYTVPLVAFSRSLLGGLEPYETELFHGLFCVVGWCGAGSVRRLRGVCVWPMGLLALRWLEGFCGVGAVCSASRVVRRVGRGFVRVCDCWRGGRAAELGSALSGSVSSPS